MYACEVYTDGLADIDTRKYSCIGIETNVRVLRHNFSRAWHYGGESAGSRNIVLQNKKNHKKYLRSQFFRTNVHSGSQNYTL